MASCTGGSGNDGADGDAPGAGSGMGSATDPDPGVAAPGAPGSSGGNGEGSPSGLPIDPGAPGGDPQSVAASCDELGYSVLPNGRGGFNYEQVCYTSDMGFDKELSREAFEATVYPLLQANCSGCHSTLNTSASGAQAPMHSDADSALAHEYALTRVNFRDPEESKLVVRMRIDRHNCFGDSCAEAGAEMLAAVEAWRDRVAPMLPEPAPAADVASIEESDVLAAIARDREDFAPPTSPT